jgi:hypothetical protein
MAIAITGEWDLATPANDLGSNQANFSYSFWFKVSGAVNATQHLFCKGTTITHGFFGQIFNSNTLKVSIYTTGGSTSLNTTLVPGQTYLAVGTHNASTPAQDVYLNGNSPVATGVVTGNTVTDTTLPVHLGCDGSNTPAITVTISQPAVYYTTLTAQNSLDLLLGNTTPVALGAVWCPTLSGTLGTAPQANDVGLDNHNGTLGAGAGNKYVLSSINPINGSGSAQYVADLSYTIPCTLNPYVSYNGLIIVGMGNSTNTSPSDVTAVGTAPTVRVNGSPITLGPVTWSDTSHQNPFISFQPQSVTIHSTDVVDFTIPFGQITTALGACSVVASPVVIPNFVGQLEAGFGGFPAFGETPTMPAGINIDLTPWVNYWALTPTMNGRLKLGTPWTVVSGSAPVYNSTDPTLVETFGANGVLSAFFYNPQTTNGIEVAGLLNGLSSATWSATNGSPSISTNVSQTVKAGQLITLSADATQTVYTIQATVTGTSFTISPSYAGTGSTTTATAHYAGQLGYPTPQGHYSIVFDDVNANNANALEVWLVANPNVCTGSDLASGHNTGPGNTWTRSVAGNGTTVTVDYELLYASNPNYNYGYNMGIFLYIRSPLGYFNHNGTISDFWMFIPGDSKTASNYAHFPNANGNDRSNPFAMANLYKAAFTSTNGNGPCVMRGMEALAAAGAIANIQTPADLTSDTLFTFGLQTPAAGATVTAVRFLNFNAGNVTYGWSSPHLYHPLLGVDGSDSIGTYIDMSLNRNGSLNDNGQCLDGLGGSPDNWAVMEFVTSAPHGFRSGDWIIFPAISDGSITPNAVPITGLPSPVTLSGTATVTHGSATITFGTSQTLANNTCVTIDGTHDTTGQAYRIATGGTGTVFSLFPNYGGTSTSSATVTTCAQTSWNNLKTYVYVTSSTTFAVVCANTFGVTTGNTTQTMLATTQIACNFQVQPIAAGRCSYGCFAALTTNWPNCAAWVPTQTFMNDACLRAIADQMAPQLATGATVIPENGLEHWNPGFPSGLACGVYGNLVKFMPPNTAINTYYTTPSTQAAVVALNKDQAYMLITAHQQDVLAAEFATFNKGITVDRMMGSWFTSTTLTGQMVTFANSTTPKIPCSSFAIAPYIDTPTIANGADSTWKTACSASGGAWPVGQIHDWNRHYVRYSSTLQSYLAAHKAAILTYTGPSAPNQIGGKPRVVAYEFSPEVMDPAGGVQLQHDLFYSPDYARYWAACAQYCQDGGVQSIADYGAGGTWGGLTEQQPWNLYIYTGQVAGAGLSNKFTTAQGGSPGDGLKTYDWPNQSVAGFAFQNWINSANVTPTPPTPVSALAKRWFSGLGRRRFR